MAELITISQLSALIEDQYRLLGYIEDISDRGERLPAFDPVDPERNQLEVSIAGEQWSVTATRSCWEFCHREARRVVLLQDGHPSPFDFQPGTLLRYVLSTDEASRLNDLILDNWILKLVRIGRLTRSRHRDGYYTFA